jgi:hypothetical protein
MPTQTGILKMNQILFTRICNIERSRFPNPRRRRPLAATTHSETTTPITSARGSI